MDEHDRLAGELRALDMAAEPSADPEPPVALNAVPAPLVAPEPSVNPEPSVDPEPPTNVVRLPARRPLSRTRMVSPKVARLMHAPRRPALERAGVARVGAGRLASSLEELVDEIDAEGVSIGTQ